MCTCVSQRTGTSCRAEGSEYWTQSCKIDPAIWGDLHSYIQLRDAAPTHNPATTVGRHAHPNPCAHTCHHLRHPHFPHTPCHSPSLRKASHAAPVPHPETPERNPQGLAPTASTQPAYYPIWLLRRPRGAVPAEPCTSHGCSVGPGQAHAAGARSGPPGWGEGPRAPCGRVWLRLERQSKAVLSRSSQAS